MVADALVALLWLVLTAYALTGGADFGGGMWDLFASGSRRAGEVRAVIAESIAPVWEANHVWLVIVLVLLWTGLPQAFGAIMSTLFVPLSIAVFGIVLRGSGFALRQVARSYRYQRVAGGLFALSSLITPFFFGAAAGAIVTGQVPRTGTGNRIASWTTATDVTLGVLSIAAFAYLAAVYLIHESQRRHPGLTGYFRRLAVASGVVVGALGALALYELETSAPRIVTRLTTGVGLPFLVVSAVLGASVLAAVLSGRARFVPYLRFAAAGAFTALLWGWAVSQYPAVLPRSLSLYASAAPTSSLVTELVVGGVIAAIVGPSFVLLYRLSQRGLLGEEESGAGLLAHLQHEDPESTGRGLGEGRGGRALGGGNGAEPVGDS